MNNERNEAIIKGVFECQRKPLRAAPRQDGFSPSTFGSYDERESAHTNSSSGHSPAKSDGWAEDDDEIKSNQYAIGNFQKPPDHAPPRRREVKKFCKVTNIANEVNSDIIADRHDWIWIWRPNSSTSASANEIFSVHKMT